MKNILTCMCEKCGDTYNLDEAFKNMTKEEQDRFKSNEQTCLRCSKKYLPSKHIYNMDEFVFNLVRNCKM